MDKFNRIIEQSKAVRRFAEVEGLSTGQLYELFYECLCAYRDMFQERIKHGYELRRVIKAYKHLDEFRFLRPSELSRIVFTSRTMAHWFACMWWRAIDEQVSANQIDKKELQIRLTFMNDIPSAETMEEILNEQKSKKDAARRIFSARQVAETSLAENRTGEPANRAAVY